MAKMDLSALLATVTNKAAALSAASGKNNAVKPPSGKSRWRILPGWRPEDQNTFFHDFAQHWIKDAAGTVLGVFTCEHKTFGRECEACDTVNEAIRGTKDDLLLKKLKDMQGRGGILVNALRRDGDAKSDTQPVLLTLTGGVFEDYLKALTEAGGSGVNLLDLEEGRDIVIERTGSGMTDTKYSLTVAAVSTKISEDVMANVTNIDIWIEADRKKGIAKGIGVVGQATRALTGGVVLPGRRLSPPAAALVPTGRVIEAEPEDAELEAEAAEVAEAVVPKVVVKKVAAKAPAKAAAVDPELLTPDELDALLEDL